MSKHTLTILDATIPVCYLCGRQEIDRISKLAHTPATCYVKLHEDRNTDPNVAWKDSANGKAYMSLYPPYNTFPYFMFKDGSVRVVPKKGNYCLPCEYLTSLNQRFTNHSPDFILHPCIDTGGKEFRGKKPSGKKP